MEVITKEQAKKQGLINYFTGIPCKNGHISSRLVSDGSCKECKQAIRDRLTARDPSYFTKRQTAWTKKNPQKAKEQRLRTKQKHGSAQSRRWRHTNPHQYILTRARMGAIKRGLEFNITINDIDFPTHCPILYIELKYVSSGGRPTDDTASIDRIDNTIGYIPTNVRIISWRANRLKSDASIWEIERLFRYVSGLAKSE